MTDEEKERAVLRYLSSNADERETYRSLTTIFEQFSRPAEWRSSFFDNVDRYDDDKEALGNFLDHMVVDGLIEVREDENAYERAYRITDQGIYEASGFDQVVADVPSNALVTESGDPITTEDGDFIVSEDVAGEGADAITADSAAWTGLSKTIIDARNAKAISRLIGKALDSLPTSQAGNFEIMQATAYLKAARELVDAPEPPSELIWQMIGRAADLVGLLGLFVMIFQAFN